MPYTAVPCMLYVSALCAVCRMLCAAGCTLYVYALESSHDKDNHFQALDPSTESNTGLFEKQLCHKSGLQ